MAHLETAFRYTKHQGDSRSVEELKYSNGVNTKVQLWQFLLELLCNNTSSRIITWEGEHGEFRLNNPGEVAKLWGERSGRLKMTYQTMSRALRHYYCKGILSKVKHKKWCYRFSIDILDGAGTVTRRTCLPAMENTSSEELEHYKAVLANEEYLKAAQFSLPMPNVNLYPIYAFWSCVPNFSEYRGPVIHNFYDCL